MDDLLQAVIELFLTIVEAVFGSIPCKSKNKEDEEKGESRK